MEDTFTEIKEPKTTDSRRTWGIESRIIQWENRFTFIKIQKPNLIIEKQKITKNQAMNLILENSLKSYNGTFKSIVYWQ